MVHQVEHNANGHDMAEHMQEKTQTGFIQCRVLTKDYPVPNKTCVRQALGVSGTHHPLFSLTAELASNLRSCGNTMFIQQDVFL